MAGMWGWHFLARVTRYQARRELEVPLCMEVTHASGERPGAITETTCIRHLCLNIWAWTAVKTAGSWEDIGVKTAKGSSWLLPEHR